MSEEAPETADAAIRGYIAAIGFTLVLVGGEMMAAKEGGRFALGAVLLIAGLPCYLAAGLWNSVKSKLSTRNLATLGMVAGDVRWWLGTLAILVLIGFFTPIDSIQLGILIPIVILAVVGLVLAFVFGQRAPKTKTASHSALTEEALLATVPQLTYSTDRIYVGNIFTDNPWGQLTTNRYIEFLVRIYNANDVEFALTDIAGTIGCRQLSDPPIHLQPLNFTDLPIIRPKIKSLPAFRETAIGIWQHVPADVADNILKALNQSPGVQFNFEKLDIQLQDPESKTSIRLPLRDGIELGRDFRSRRAHNVAIHETVSAKDSS